MKRPISGFDNETFSDCKLKIIEPSTNNSAEFNVSKFTLASPSSFFKNLFKQNSPTVTVRLEGKETIDEAKDALLCTYKEEPQNTKREHLINVMILSTPKRWDLPKTIKMCVKYLNVPISAWDPSLRVFFDLPKELSEIPHVKEKLLNRLEDLAVASFTSVREIFYEQKDTFMALPFDCVCAILRENTIEVDSENSLFYALWMWLKGPNNEKKEKEYLSIALKYIRFPQMRRYFLMDVVPFVASQFSEIKHEIMFLAQLAMEVKLVCQKKEKDKVEGKYDEISDQELAANYPQLAALYLARYPKDMISPDFLKERKVLSGTWPMTNPFDVESLHSKTTLTINRPEGINPFWTCTSKPPISANSFPLPHKSFSKVNSFTIKCEFRNIAQLDTKLRYYSAPVVAHGYEFYFFLRKQPIAPKKDKDDPTNQALAGYLRCTSKILPPKYYLPIRSTVAIQTADNLQRKFAPSEVIFEAPEKAIGGRLTLLDESWKTIEDRLCPIVVDDTLTAFVTVEFLDEDTLCKTVEETLNE